MFGYIRDPESPRDWQWGSLMGAPPADIPSHLSYESLMGPASDQGGTFECVCYAVAGVKRYHEFKQNGSWLTFDPHDLYNKCKLVDGFPHSNGTFPRVAMDILRKEGMLADDGQRYPVSAAARLGSVADIRFALANQGPVLIGMRIDLGYFSNLGNKDFQVEGIDKAHFAGHAMLVVGYDDAKEQFRIRNSWGAKWGDSGHLWLPYEYLTSVDPQFDAWSTVDA